MTLLVWLSAVVVAALISDEVLAWSPRLARLLIYASTRKLPSDIRERVYEEYLADVEDLPGKFGKLLAALDSFRSVYVINLHRCLPGISPWTPLILRLLDVIFASTMLLCCLPIIAFVMLVIWINNGFKGDVLSRAERIGLQGKLFVRLRFQTTFEDQTLTRIGRILRREGLDLLPTLINVLRGDMSMVGPVAVDPVLEQKISAVLHSYMDRHRVKPGLIRLAQSDDVMPRSFAESHVLLDYDLQYADRYSVMLYLKVFFVSFRKGCREISKRLRRP